LEHSVDALRNGVSAIIGIKLMKAAGSVPSVFDANDHETAELAKTREHLVKKYSQWLYFERNFRVYAENTVYLLKPMERIQWTRRQAILDAGEVIAETLGQKNI
jgi:hypothetical protein